MITMWQYANTAHAELKRMLLQAMHASKEGFGLEEWGLMQAKTNGNQRDTVEEYN